eukprot:CAMPEP_0170397146 /NCGR_PEP_ID=MMETSP0117_2-20130122/22716_1 /TAXON_ID=400756 /ORGANISM="Durinskia baltica, Strain CSIRO CS-38" /LENGTH=778 /DNA_ID=CAMNT_0010653623 /DNA_START=39 /DNA_END=2375 /DNA_ORIENTATION=-
MYEPEEDPFLISYDEDDEDSPQRPPPRALPRQQSNLNNYQYQPHQSMYNMPQPGPPPPRMLRSNPSFMMGPPPPGPMLRPTPSFYMDPGMQPQYGMPQPYGMQQSQIIMPPPLVPAYVSTPSYPERTSLTDQIEEFQRYQRNRPAGSSNAADNSLLIATMVSEQDAMYGTNMLENITPMDDEYIQTLMQRGVPEHEALRMAFDRKPHVPKPPKVSRNVDTVADAQALEEAIQLSLSESSRRASQPDNYSSGLGTTSTDLIDQEALNTAIQLSLSEQAQKQNDYISANYAAESQRHASNNYTSSHTDYTQHNRYNHNSAQYSSSGVAGTYRDADEYSVGSDPSYYSRDETRGRYAEPEPEPAFDRQYPYNLTREAPAQALQKHHSIASMDKYRQAQLQQQEYIDHLQHASPPVTARSHHTDHYTEYTDTRSAVALDAEQLRAMAYGRTAAAVASPPPAYYDEPPLSGRSGEYEYDRRYVEDYRTGGVAAMRGHAQYDDYSQSSGSRSRSDSGDEGYPYGGPAPAYDRPPAQYYNRDPYAGHPSPRDGPVPPAYPSYPPGPAYAPRNNVPPPMYDDGDSDEEGKMEPPPRFEVAQGHKVVPGVSKERLTTVDPRLRAVPTLTRGPSARDLRNPLSNEVSEQRSRSPSPGSTVRTSQAAPAPQFNHRAGVSTIRTNTVTSYSNNVNINSTSTGNKSSSYISSSAQRPAVPARPQLLTAHSMNSTGSGTSRSSGIASAAAEPFDPNEPPPEFDDSGEPVQKHAWRNTLKKLVNDLNADSDED